MNCLLIATTLVFSFWPGHVSAGSALVMLCALHSQDNSSKVELRASLLRLTNFYRPLCVHEEQIQEYFFVYLPDLIGWTLSYTASAREMHLVFATHTAGMKPVNLCLLELCSLAYIDMPTARRNRAGGYASLLTLFLHVIICFLISLLYVVLISVILGKLC